MNDIKTIIKNAKSVCKKDGYPQIIYTDNRFENEVSFTRLYPNIKLINCTVIAIIECGWMSGIFHTRLISDNDKINDIIKLYSVSL